MEEDIMSEEYDNKMNDTDSTGSGENTGYTDSTENTDTVDNTGYSEGTEYTESTTDASESTTYGESTDTSDTAESTDYTAGSENENFGSSDSYNGYSNSNGYYSSSNQKVYDKHEARADKRLQKQRAKAERLNKKNEQKRNNGGSGFFNKFVKFVCAAVVFGVIAGGVAMAFGYGYDYFKGKDAKKIEKTPVVEANNEPESETDKETEKDILKEADTETKSSDSDNSSKGSVIITDVSDVVENVMPSVVSITSTEIISKAGGDDFWSYFYGDGGSQQYESQGAGSGIIIGENDTELLIVTNKHVVADADTLSVQFMDGKSVDASIKSQNEKQDLAIVSIPLSKIDSDTMESIKIATIGESDDMKVGEGCIAIGNALGYGQSVTTGVISALDRTINVDNIERKVIQTDAAINPGNSGGALLNMKGEVIGINSAKSVDEYTEGMGYAIPMSNVKDLLGNMMSQETRDKVDDAQKGYLNIYGKDVTEELSEMYDIPEGVYVIEVIEDGAAEKAGINKYDVITGIDGDSVTSMAELQEKLSYYKKGEKVKVTVQTLKDKEYTEKEIEVKLEEQRD